tara:strand:+ start:6091 stop:7068 length:978 start_codon:yes stop_codon:yes gene_type:complete
MSGSAANASARKRRAGNGEEEPVNNQQNKPPDKRGLSPLQILQAHENRLKKLEEKPSETIYSEKNDETKPVKNISVNTTDIENKIKKDLEILSNNHKAIEDRTNIELSRLSKNIEDLVNENSSLKTEINELKDIKLLLIKTQTLGLETSKDVYDIKSELTNINRIFEDNKNFENNKEGDMVRADENSVFDLLKHMLISKMGNDNDDNDEKELLSEEINPNINLSEYEYLTNEINDLSELDNEDDDLFNKLKDLTENINTLDRTDNNELEDINKNTIQENIINEIKEVLNGLDDSIEKEEVLEQRIDEGLEEPIEEPIEELLEVTN